MKISQIKKSGKRIIKGSVMKSSALMLAFASILILFSVLPFAADFLLKGRIIPTLAVLSAVLILCLAVLSSFGTGSKAWFLFYNKKRRSEKTVFWFRPSKAFKSMGMYFSLIFRKLVWTLVFTAPGLVLIASAVLTAISGGVEFNMFATWIAGGTVLALTGIVFLYFYLQKFFLVPYLRAANPSMKNKDVFLKSREYMNSSIKKTALMKFSFLPWFVVSLTVIPAAYVWAYYSQSCAVMAKEICRNHIENQGTANEII